MTWIAVVVLAVAAFAIGALAFKVSKGLWTSLLAALALGLAGYALQASPAQPSAPKAGGRGDDAALFDIVETRKQFLSISDQSSAQFVPLADAMAQQGRYQEAAQMLAGVTRADPQDFEAWLAQGNALVEHADGILTPPALYAYRQAVMLKPDHLAPNYFLGVSLIRQGRMMEARQVWSESLANAPAGASGADVMTEQLGRLEEMLGTIGADLAPAPEGSVPEETVPAESMPAESVPEQSAPEQ